VKTFTPLARAIRIAIGGAAGLTAALTAAPGIAQDQAGALDEVVITGSRIRQNPLEERLPVLTVGADDYAASGATSIADFVQKLPISGSAINRMNNSSGNLGYPPDGGGIGAGAAEIDLRYLASKRVLVLVDGRRWVKGSSGSGVSGAVDLNSIPANAIKSIEILQDGAVRGLWVGRDRRRAERHHGRRLRHVQDLRLRRPVRRGRRRHGGVRHAHGRRGRAQSRPDRRQLHESGSSEYGRPQELGVPHLRIPFGISSGTPNGRFVFCNLDCDPDSLTNDTVSVTPEGLNPVYIPGDPNNADASLGGADDFHHFETADRFNYQPYNHLVTPNERINVFAKGEYDIADNIQFKALASFNNRKSQGRAAPVPLFFGLDGGSTPYMVNYLWPANHPFNPFGVDLDGTTNATFVTKRPTEAGPRIFDQDVDTWYLSGGFEGDFEVGSRTYYWDVTGIKSENNARQTKHNQFNARYLNLGLGDPAVCAATPNCVPINIVGEGSLTRRCWTS
jgi:iron complex outermembrane receptor protein